MNVATIHIGVPAAALRTLESQAFRRSLNTWRRSRANVRVAALRYALATAKCNYHAL